MSEVISRRVIPRIGPLQIAIILLAVATALIHLDRALSMGFLGMHLGGGGPPAGGGHFPGGGSGGPPAGVRPGGGAGGPGGGSLSFIRQNLTLLFFLNFLSYIILATALYLKPFVRIQPIIRWALIVLAVITITAYFMISGTHVNIMGYTDKVIEGVLIILLLVDHVQSIRQGGGEMSNITA